MLAIQRIDHVGIRVGDRERSLRFYGRLGFELVSDAGFDRGHPLILRHSCGVTLNLLGPSTEARSGNILMDVAEKYPGYTHIALEVASLDDAKATLAEEGIEITGSFRFGSLSAVFIRDPDRNVIELDFHGGPRMDQVSEGYADHP